MKLFKNPKTKFFALIAAATLAAPAANAGGYVTTVTEPDVIVLSEQEPHNWSGTYGGVQVTAYDSNDIDDSAGYGAFVGHRHQYANGLVVGTEAAYNAADGTTETATVKTQVGYALDKWLPFVSGGYASVKIDGVSYDETAYGIGVDRVLKDNWLAGIEYQYIDVKDADTRVDRINARLMMKF